MILLLYTFPMLALSMSVTGCGIKPSKLDPPPGAKGNGYPLVYPDLSTDPKPVPPK